MHVIENVSGGVERQDAQPDVGRWSSARPVRRADGAVRPCDPTTWCRVDSCVTAISSRGSRSSRLTRACWRRRRTSRSWANLLFGSMLHIPEDRLGILGELEQRRHEGQRVHALDSRISLVAQMGVHLLDDLVIEVGPPAWLLGIFRPPGQRSGQRGALDVVVVDQVPDVTRVRLALGVLQPRQLAGRDQQLRSNVVEALAGLVAQPPEVVGDGAPWYERAGDLIGHGLLAAPRNGAGHGQHPLGIPSCKPYYGSGSLARQTQEELLGSLAESQPALGREWQKWLVDGQVGLLFRTCCAEAGRSDGFRSLRHGNPMSELAGRSGI